ncbi:MAG: hypothetical protein L3J71_04140 [Victivallaceae bacterium]|nr:hypothetical protein [Victivallaceae bacterium]
MRGLVILIAGILLLTTQYSIGALKHVTVKTKAKSNYKVKVYYRVPSGYQQKGRGSYRVLVIFGGRNCSGRGQAAGSLGFARWADEHDIFLVGPGFTDSDYWYPEKWSGKALLKALKLIKKQYRINDTRLLYYGYSGGSQCSNLFPAWRPQLCVAWVSHACGVWHQPTSRMRDIPGLVTCGDADFMRYILSRNFAEKARSKGELIIWKSFPNHPHDVPPDSIKLAKKFLSYHHKRNIGDLQYGFGKGILVRRGKPKYIGDDQEGQFWRANSIYVKYIDPEDRVEFFSKDIALVWGKEGK